MALKLITPPSIEPLTLAEVKAHLRKTTSDEDALITNLIKAIRQHLDGRDGILGRAFIEQTWELQMDGFPTGDIRIPLPPLVSIMSLRYLDEAGTDQLMDPLTYDVDIVSEPGWVIMPISGWPTTGDFVNSVKVRFVAGYGAAATAVPESIKTAMLLLIANLFENREATVSGTIITKLPLGIDMLLSPYRVMLP